jgi:RNase adapter protein RapZ
VIIAGLSGAGRSSAADDFEDLGWFVIDNLPPALIPKVAELAAGPEGTYERVALAVGTTSELAQVLPSIASLRAADTRVRVLFLDASTEVLVRRYEGTRRRHPLASSDVSLAQAIDRERELLEEVKAEADVVVDTTELNVHQLRERIRDLFPADDPAGGMQTTVVSFGYKHGLPLDVDLVLDCRFLPNPHWDEALRPLTGLDAPVRTFVLRQPETREFLDQLRDLLDLLLPAYEKEGKSYLTIAFGCTGGRHRSVAIAEEIATHLRRHGHRPTVTHRDLDR